jgi:hypothetical protein
MSGQRDPRARVRYYTAMQRSYAEVRRDAVAALESGDARKAFSIFRWALEYPGQFDAGEFADALEVFARIAQAIAGDELAGFVRKGAARPEDPEALYDLGYQLIDQQLHGIASTVLARAFECAPKSPRVLAELCAALEGADRHAVAYAKLRHARGLVDKDFVLRYLLAFNALMSGEIDAAAKELPELEQRLPAANADLAHMLATIRRLLGRVSALRRATSLDLTDLRGWHAVVNGGLLLHRSPYGFDEGMHGRYAFTQDSEARCAAALRFLAAALARLGRTPRRVFALPDRESEVLAEAAAVTFGVPVGPWPDAGATEPGLVVAYDLASVPRPALATLIPHRPQQMLFAHACCWTEPPVFTPDVCAYMHQVNVSPWGARQRVDMETRQMVEVPPETADARSLGERCSRAEPETEGFSDLEAVLRLCDAMATLGGNAAPGVLRDSGERERFRTDSPVKSSRFL